MKRRTFLLSLTGSAAAGLMGWKLSSSRRGLPEVFRFEQTARALGTEVKLTVFHPHRREAEEALRAAFAELDRVEDLMSLYRPQSALCRLNATGRIDAPDPDLVSVLELSAELSAATEGAFDVTVQPLWELYAAQAAQGTLPTAAELAPVLRRVDWRRVNVSATTITLAPGTAVTLNGIAQGFAADRVGAVLRERGITSALIDTGEVGTVGTHAEKDHWSIGLKHPRSRRELLGVAALRGRCLATSGDYETTFDSEFRSHHLIDPRTGHSPTELCSVSVAAPTATQADALSTALFLLGIERGRALLAQYPQTDALFVTKAGHRVSTAHFPLLG